MANWRIFDLVTLSIFPSLLLGLVGSLKFVEFAIFTVVALGFTILYNNPRRFPLRLNFPGVFFTTFLAIFSLVHLALDFARGDKVLVKLLTIEQTLSIAIFVFGLFFFMRGIIKERI